MPSKLKQYHYHTPCEDDRMAERGYGEWSKQLELADPIAEVSEKLAALHIGVPAEPPAANKRPKILDIMYKTLFTFKNRYVTQPDMQSASACMGEKEQHFKKSPTHTSPRIPIFETNKNGKGQLMVPLDNSCTDDDVALPPPGLYEEDLAYSAPYPRRVRKRRKETSKANHHAHGGSEYSGCGKNRKEKKRHALRSDIRTDNLALSMDHYCYPYGCREVRKGNAMDVVQSSSQRWPLPGFSPSSTGSVGSFHDALQDGMLPVECLQLQASYDNVQPAPVSNCDSQQTHTANAFTSVPPSTVNTITDQEKQCSGMDPNLAGFEVLADYEVFMTPSASPVPRPFLRDIRKAISYVCHGGDDEEDDDDDDEDDQCDYTSGDDGNSYDGSDGFEEDDDDDFSIVFCQDYDDLHEDSNSSSGFDEKKVRFNTKPVVHVMRVWDFAYRQARKGDWETTARDSERFRKRIADLEPVLGPALQPALRDKIYAERFSGQQEHTRNPESL
uniref:Uncharacterized protein n=1 Tax=Anopheles culicifacies TaxID=139723 RepID=A0A182MSM9_9DIPT